MSDILAWVSESSFVNLAIAASLARSTLCAAASSSLKFARKRRATLTAPWADLTEPANAFSNCILLLRCTFFFQTTAQLPSFQPLPALPSLPQALRTAQPITHTLLLPAERLTHGTTPNKLEALVHWSSPACCCQQPQPPPRGLRGQPVGRQQSLSRWHHRDGA